MDIIRRNTDYALRAMIHLAKKWNQEPISTKEISETENISYQLTCKLFQKLQKAKLVKSTMGPSGGFSLTKKPENINLNEIITVIQGPISTNKCFLDLKICKRKNKCPLRKKLQVLQSDIGNYRN